MISWWDVPGKLCTKTATHTGCCDMEVQIQEWLQQLLKSGSCLSSSFHLS